MVIDADATGQVGPVGEFSIPVEIPARVLATLAGDADVHAVVVRNGVVLHAPGELNLGRTTRLANRAQRRAFAQPVPVLCDPRAVRSRTTVANCITSSGGATRAAPTSTICCLFAAFITPRSTTTAGSSNSDRTENSPCGSPTAGSSTRDRRHAPGEVPPPDDDRAAGTERRSVGSVTVDEHDGSFG